MKKFLKVCLIVFICLVIIGWALAALTWFNVIPNRFWIEILSGRDDNSNSNNNDNEVCYNYHKVTECRSKCEFVEWYDVQSLESRFAWKSLEIRNYCPEYYCGWSYYCPAQNLDRVECNAWPHYKTWLQDMFTLDEIEKINEYKSCFDSCWRSWYEEYNANWCDVNARWLN